MEVEVTELRARLWIDGVLELDVAADPADPFAGGRFGLYSYAQDSVLFREFARLPLLDQTAGTVSAPTIEMVDLTTFTGEHLPSSSTLGTCVWNVAGPASVRQDANCKPGVFYSAEDVAAARISGVMTLLGDDDAAGFIFGYQPQASAGPDDRYLLAMWRGSGDTGLKLFRPLVTASPVSEPPLATALTLGSTAWSANVDYHVTTEVRPDRMRLWVDGVLEFDVDAGSETFEPGRWGFYNSAQAGVRWRTYDVSAELAVTGGTSPTVALAMGDADVLDTHTATVDWGDGSGPEPGWVGETGGVGVITLDPHVFSSDGVVVPEVCVEDDKGGTTCLEVPVNVTGSGSSGSSTQAAPAGETEVPPAEQPAKEEDGPVLELFLTASLGDFDGDGLASRGESVDFTLTVVNAGDEAARSVSAISPLAAAVALETGSPLADRGAVTVEGDAIVFEPGDLLPGESATLTYRVTLVDPPLLGDLIHRAVASAVGLGVTLSDDPATPADGDATRLPVANSASSDLRGTADSRRLPGVGDSGSRS